MHATFRMRRYYRNLGIAGALGFATWGALGLWVALTDPKVTHPIAAAALMGGLPAVMTGTSLWMLAAYRRQELTVREGRVAFCGVIRRVEFDMRDVDEARWLSRPVGGSLALRAGPSRLSLVFSLYEINDRARLVDLLRSALRPDVQAGWDLFAYRTAAHRRRPASLKPGEGEVLLSRGRWDRYFATMLVIACPAGLILWWNTGRWRLAVGPLACPLFLWAVIRAFTPAEGMVTKRVSIHRSPNTARFFWFSLLWLAVGVAGIVAFDAFRSRLTHPVAVMVTGGVVWIGVLLVEAGLHDRRQAHRDQEAASLAAKARGAGSAGHWPID